MADIQIRDTATVDLADSADVLEANVKISATAGNTITANADGLFSAGGGGGPATISTSAPLSGDGSAGTPATMTDAALGTFIGNTANAGTRAAIEGVIEGVDDASAAEIAAIDSNTQVLMKNAAGDLRCVTAGDLGIGSGTPPVTGPVITEVVGTNASYGTSNAPPFWNNAGALDQQPATSFDGDTATLTAASAIAVEDSRGHIGFRVENGEAVTKITLHPPSDVNGYNANGSTAISPSIVALRASNSVSAWNIEAITVNSGSQPASANPIVEITITTPQVYEYYMLSLNWHNGVTDLTFAEIEVE